MSSDEDDDPSIICSICHDFFEDNIVASSCGHVFHRQCITTWLSRRKSTARCPSCNVEQRVDQLIDLTQLAPRHLMQLAHDSVVRERERVEADPNHEVSDEVVPRSTWKDPLFNTMENQKLQRRFAEVYPQVAELHAEELALRKQLKQCTEMYDRRRAELKVVREKNRQVTAQLSSDQENLDRLHAVVARLERMAERIRNVEESLVAMRTVKEGLLAGQEKRSAVDSHLNALTLNREELSVLQLRAISQLLEREFNQLPQVDPQVLDQVADLRQELSEANDRSAELIREEKRLKEQVQQVRIELETRRAKSELRKRPPPSSKSKALTPTRRSKRLRSSKKKRKSS